jgi:hypothetical protein
MTAAGRIATVNTSAPYFGNFTPSVNSCIAVCNAADWFHGASGHTRPTERRTAKAAAFRTYCTAAMGRMLMLVILEVTIKFRWRPET